MYISKLTYLFLLITCFTVTLSAQEDMDWKVPPYDIEKVALEDTPFPPFLEDDQMEKIRYILIGVPDSLKRELKPIRIEKEDPKVYRVSELDRMPLFEEACAQAEEPMDCSFEKAAEFFERNLKYPEAAIQDDEDGFVRLLFMINEEGWVEGKIKVLNDEKACTGCEKAAIEAVYNMPAWRPAKVDGKAVKSMVILPINFHTPPIGIEKG